jgi:hypothetical protein
MSKGGEKMLLKETFDKLDSALQALICLDKPLHDRLDIAINTISVLTAKDLPDCRKEFNLLVEKIQFYRYSGDRLDLQANLARSIFELLKTFLLVTSSGFGFVTL